MAITPSYITARMPELASASVLEIQAAIDDAAVMFSADAFGPRADLAHAYLAAHVLASRKPGLASAAVGALQSVTVGPITKTYATAGGASSPTSGVPAEYAGSKYGVLFWGLAAQNDRGPVVGC